MATKAKAANVAASAAVVSPEMLAMFQQFMAAQGAPAAVKPAAKATKTETKSATVELVEQRVREAITSRGGRVSRLTSPRLSPKGNPAAWVQADFGGLLVQGNFTLYK